jgi:hypothetical protein
MANKYWTDILSKFSGSVIEKAVSDSKGEFFGLQIKTPFGKHKVIWFLSDEEGNNPGAFEVNELKPEKEIDQ